jgi:hypothetical protein
VVVAHPHLAQQVKPQHRQVLQVIQVMEMLAVMEQAAHSKAEAVAVQAQQDQHSMVAQVEILGLLGLVQHQLALADFMQAVELEIEVLQVLLELLVQVAAEHIPQEQEQ